MFDTITSSLETKLNGEKLCITNKKLGDAIVMNKRFGSPSAFGEAWIGYSFKNGYKVAVKKMPLGKHDQVKSFTEKQMLSGDSAWPEMAAYHFCTLLVMAKICPNLPVMYKYFWCPKCKFVNRKIRGKKKEGPCVLVVNELADGDLKTYLEKKIHIWYPELVTNCVFQICAGLYALEKFYNMKHNDLHFGNILVHEIQAGGFWHYKIDGKNYYVPNLGYMFLLWDFGMVQSPGKIKGRPEFFTMDSSPIPNETDIGRICAIMNDRLRSRKAQKYMGKKQHELLGDIIRNERRQQSVKEILDKHFRAFKQRVKPKGDEILDSYNMDVNRASFRAAHQAEFRKYVR
jgi:hypothetical protein